MYTDLLVELKCRWISVKRSIKLLKNSWQPPYLIIQHWEYLTVANTNILNVATSTSQTHSSYYWSFTVTLTAYHHFHCYVGLLHEHTKCTEGGPNFSPQTLIGWSTKHHIIRRNFTTQCHIMFHCVLCVLVSDAFVRTNCHTVGAVKFTNCYTLFTLLYFIVIFQVSNSNAGKCKRNKF